MNRMIENGTNTSWLLTLILEIAKTLLVYFV